MRLMNFRLITITTVFIIIIDLLLTSCGKEQSFCKIIDGEPNEYSGSPTITVFIVPLDKMNVQDAEKLRKEFAANFADKKREAYRIETLDHSNVPDSCYNPRHTRYSAKKVIEFLEAEYGQTAKKKALQNAPSKGESAYYIIGVTNKDISTAIHGSDDYGILGLSYLNSNRIHNSIISTYRLSRKKDLWKLAAHEFCHGFYNMPHCPNDYEYCLMQDAKGGNPHFELKDTLCVECTRRCIYMN